MINSIRRIYLTEDFDGIRAGKAWMVEIGHIGHERYFYGRTLFTTIIKAINEMRK